MEVINIIVETFKMKYHNKIMSFVDELQKLVDMGYGKLVSKDKMKKDKILPSNQCSNVYMKPEMTFMDANFFSMVMDSELKYKENCHKVSSSQGVHTHVSNTRK